MKLKDRIKTYNFWVSLASAVFLILNIIGQKFNFCVDESIFNDIFTAICSILVILGIIVPPVKTKSSIGQEPLVPLSEESQELDLGTKSQKLFDNNLLISSHDISDKNREEVSNDSEDGENEYLNTLQDADEMIDDNKHAVQLSMQLDGLALENIDSKKEQEISENVSNSSKGESNASIIEDNLTKDGLIRILREGELQFSGNIDLFKQILTDELSRLNK